jgi:hypothetical protein
MQTAKALPRCSGGEEKEEKRGNRVESVLSLRLRGFTVERKRMRIYKRALRVSTERVY